MTVGVDIVLDPITADCTIVGSSARVGVCDDRPGSPGHVDHGLAGAPDRAPACAQPPECGNRAREETTR